MFCNLSMIENDVVSLEVNFQPEMQYVAGIKYKTAKMMLCVCTKKNYDIYRILHLGVVLLTLYPAMALSMLLVNSVEK